MATIHPAFVEYQRKRFARPDAVRRLRHGDELRRLLSSAPSGSFKFNPDQPRVPAGKPDGGQWTTGLGSVGVAENVRPEGITDPRVLSDAEPEVTQPGVQYAQNRARAAGSVIINGQRVEISPGQAARLAEAQSSAEAATARVREIDRNWKPEASAYSTTEGLIRAYRSDAEQARARASELASYGLAPGPFACDSIPARSPDRNFTAAERKWALRAFRENGCHTCGTKEAGTPSGRPVLDHQPVTALNFFQKLQRLYPQCWSCSLMQGGWARYFRMRW